MPCNTFSQFIYNKVSQCLHCPEPTTGPWYSNNIGRDPVCLIWHASYKGTRFGWFSTQFYQKFLPIIGTSVVLILKAFMNHELSLCQINQIYISLIPKGLNPQSPVDFRLCNVIYKIIAKVLAHRLKMVLHSTISEEQVALLQGRVISHNIILSFETFH